MPHPALARVVVDEADRGRAEVRVELQLADDHLAAGAGADDEHLVPLGDARAARGPLDDQPHREPGAGDQQQGEQEVDDRDRARQVVRRTAAATVKATTRIALATATARTISRKSRPLT